MRSVFFPRLVNDPFGDPALYVLLPHRGEALLFDCGDLHPLPARDLLKIRHIFISHAHIDHLAGFDALLRHFLYREEPLRLYGPPGFTERVAHKLAGYTWNLIESYPLTVIVREWGEESGKETTFRAREAFQPGTMQPVPCSAGVLLDTPDYCVRAIPLTHGDIVSLGFALEETLHVAVHGDVLEARGYLPGPWLTELKQLLRRGADGTTPITIPLTGGGEETQPLRTVAAALTHAERGMKIVYITDVAPTDANAERIVALAADAHLLAIEAAFSHRDLSRAQQRNHLTAAIAGTLGHRAGAARLLVFHHSPRYQDEPQLLAEEATQAFRTGRPPAI
jgi:ribonuclease Z